MRQDDAERAQAIILGLLRQAKNSTMKSTYGRLIPDEAGVLRSFMNPGGTETGRFNHGESFLDRSTNLANLANKMAALDPLYQVRDCIIPHERRLLGKADYSQAEARWCAWIAEDPIRIRYFEEGIDQYKLFISVLKHGNDGHMDEVSKMERQAIGKPGILAGQYGVSWRTLLDNINKDADLTGIAIDAKTAKKMEAIIPELFPRTAEWWDEIEEQVLGKGYLVNPFGRRRDFHGRTDTSAAKAGVVREGIAFGPQSANADMVNTALRRLHAEHQGGLIDLLLQVHDEIVFDCGVQDGMKAALAVKKAMEFPVEVHGRELLIPAEVKLSSKNWNNMREVA